MVHADWLITLVLAPPQVQDEIDKNVLRSAKVIGLTTTGVASHQRLIRALGPRVIIVEEAAEARALGILPVVC